MLTTFGQDKEDNEYISALPDTFKFFKATDLKYYSTLDSIKGIIFDSITKPTAYFIDTYNEGGYSWCIAIKQKGKYVVFNPFQNSSAYTETSNLTFERKNFNGKGNEELIIKWQFYTGHTGWENSIHERQGGVLIWDLDNLTMLFDYDNYYSLQNWWSTFEPDSTGALDYSERETIESGGDYECKSYCIKIEKNSLTIQQENNCPDQGDMNKYPILDKTIYSYELTKKALIKIK